MGKREFAFLFKGCSSEQSNFLSLFYGRIVFQYMGLLQFMWMLRSFKKCSCSGFSPNLIPGYDVQTGVRTIGVAYWCLSSPVYDGNEAGFLEFRKLIQGSGKSSESLPSDEQKAVINKTLISKRHSHRKLRKAGLKPWTCTQEEGGGLHGAVSKYADCTGLTR